MKKLGDLLLNRSSFEEIVMGNSAIVRAMIETGTRIVTSYPGSPTPEIADAIASIEADKRPFYFEFSVNEKVATEVAFGGSVNGHLSCVFFKSVGLNVAADSFVQLGHFELIGGMIIVLGDDPGAHSSQNEQDNRHFAALSHIPVFEPASPTEIYAMYKEAAELSQEKKMPVILRLTTHVCHAKEKIRFSAWEPKPFDKTPMFSPENGPYIPITAQVAPLKKKALIKLSGFEDYAESSSFNFLENRGNERGIITAGLPYLALLDVLADVETKPDILKLGTIYPLPKKLITDFLTAHREVLILEELDNFLETRIKALAFEKDVREVAIKGKADIEDWIGDYTPDKVSIVLRKHWPDLVPAPKRFSKSSDIAVDKLKAEIPRPPQMCPGCGHRSAFHAIKKALKRTDITVADIGCHTLGFLEPYKMGQVLLCMGHSSGTAAGLSLFNDSRKVVAFLGDSTFFHAGIPGIINAVFNNHHFTLIMMENGTTAMTGHQDHPAVGKNFRGETQKIPVRRVLESLGITRIWEVDTYQQSKLTEAVQAAIAEPGFSVVIAKHPCMLKFTRDMRKRGASLRPPVTVSERCNRQYECIKVFACPTYQFADDGSINVQKDLCIGDGSCIQTCPTRAIVQTQKEEKKG